jgi:hypothetical protein
LSNRDHRRPTWYLGVQAGIWQPEGASAWFARCEYLATLHELARGTMAPRIPEAFCALDRLVDAAPDAPAHMLVDWATRYGFLDTWLVEFWENTIDLWRSCPESRRDLQLAWPIFAYFDERAEVGTPKRTLTHFRWVALHQVEYLTYEQIAQHEQDEAGLDMSTISRAITTTARLIGVTLRPAPRRH